jgi:hypothetical protein
LFVRTGPDEPYARSRYEHFCTSLLRATTTPCGSGSPRAPFSPVNGGRKRAEPPPSTSGGRPRRAMRLALIRDDSEGPIGGACALFHLQRHDRVRPDPPAKAVSRQSRTLVGRPLRAIRMTLIEVHVQGLIGGPALPFTCGHLISFDPDSPLPKTRSSPTVRMGGAGPHEP